MMRKTITRTMATSTIHGFSLTVENGQPKTECLDPVTVMGKANDKEALRALKDKYGKDATVTVAKIEVAEDTYEISVDDFMKHAKKVDKNSIPFDEESEN